MLFNKKFKVITKRNTKFKCIIYQVQNEVYHRNDGEVPSLKNNIWPAVCLIIENIEDKIEDNIEAKKEKNSKNTSKATLDLPWLNIWQKWATERKFNN